MGSLGPKWINLDRMNQYYYKKLNYLQGHFQVAFETIYKILRTLDLLRLQGQLKYMFNYQLD